MKKIIFIISLVLAVSFFAEVSFCKEKITAERIGEIEKEMVSSGNYAEALEELLNLPEKEKTVRVRTDIAIAYYGMEDYVSAEKYFTLALEKAKVPDEEEVPNFAISMIKENKELLLEVNDLNALMRDTPEESQEAIKDRLAAVHFTIINDIVSGKSYYTSIVMPHIRWLKENRPGLGGIYSLSADLLYTAMFYDEAARDYKKALEEDPDDVRTNNTLADCLVAIGEYKEAGEYYDKTIDLYLKQGCLPDDPKIVELLRVRESLPKDYEEASTLMRRGEYYEAEKICKKRISLNPGDVSAIIQLGEIYWETGKRKQAIKLFKKAKKMAPDYPTSYFYLGKAYIFEHKPKKAMKNFDLFKEKMEKIEDVEEDTIDTYVSALYYISYMSSIYGTKEETLATAKKIIEFRPEDQRGHYNLAVVYYNDYHNRAKAYVELKKVIEIEPEGRMAELARYYIDYMRRNPDSRVIGNFNILYDK